MAESGTLPTGFGELEVLAVGTVLLVEGEPGRSRGGAGTRPGPRTQVAAAKLARRGPQTLLLCARTHGVFRWLHLRDAARRLGSQEREAGQAQGGRNFEKGTSAQGVTKNQGFSCLCSQEKVESAPWKSC